MKTFVSCLILLCAFGLHAQDKAAMDSLQGIIDRAAAALAGEKHAEAEKLYLQASAFAHSHDDNAILSWRRNYTDRNVGLCLAGIYLHQGDTARAVETFCRAADAAIAISSNTQFDYRKAISEFQALKGNADFRRQTERIENKFDMLTVLRRGGDYSAETHPDSLPRFTYLEANDPRLVTLRKTLNLDSIAGSGDEISKIKNLCLWVHNTVHHDGSSQNPEERNALALIKLCKKENRGVNCWMLSVILNECYLAMGFKSRTVTCLPKNSKDTDSHVVNIVWSKTLGKWIMADPSFYAFFLDDKGRLLGIEEARRMRIEGKTIRTNPEINWNGEPMDQARHIDYMTKNFFWFTCPANSTYDAESIGEQGNTHYLTLAPGDFKPWTRDKAYLTRDPDIFWARPE